MNDSLNVYLNNDYVGELRKDNDGYFEFQYDKNNSIQISMSLPLRDETYSYQECKGFFNGLLPESENARIAIAKRYGINYQNDFSMFQAIGYDCAGAISFFEDKKDDLEEYYLLKGKKLSSSELENYIKELPKKPLFIDVDKRLSLAGAQDKTAVIIKDDEIYLPDKYVPSTHIIKPSIESYNETVENEYICLMALKKLGIIVPEIEIRYANSVKYFLIERYDRIYKNSKVKRIHQEDFSQANNIMSVNKYEKEGGVSYKKCFEILKNTSNPALSMINFIKIMIFNFLIGNNDAHGKNFSILYKDNETILAPSYDILCSMVYPNLSKKMAMKIDKYYDSYRIFPRHFEKLANELEINYTLLKKNIINQAEILPDIIKEVISIFPNTIGKDILSVVQKNCKRNLERFKMN